MAYFLAESEDNALTPTTLPFFDLGDKPSTYDPNRDEADQMYIVPTSSYSSGRFIVKYNYCKHSFNLNTKSLSQKYAKSDFPERHLQFEDME